MFTCKIPGRVRIKKNNKRILKNFKTGKHFIGSSKEFDGWAIMAGHYVRRAKAIDCITEPVALKITANFVNMAHMQDGDNIISSIADVLEDNGVIKNDKLFYLVSCLKQYGQPKDSVEIEITAL